MLDLNFFIGSWSFERIISSPEIIVMGTCVFDKQGGMMETGSYHLCGSNQDCYQNYFYRIDQEYFYILKSNKEILHVFDTADFPNFHHTHQCGMDFYSCNFKITSKESFETFYVVHGPKKDYSLSTKYFKFPM